MSRPWPPPPDLESIQELVATADVEGFIADGAPADEYEAEAEEVHAAIASWPIERMTEAELMPVLEAVWARAFALDFALDDAQMVARRPALVGLARQIARFFGPEAQPRVRGS